MAKINLQGGDYEEETNDFVGNVNQQPMNNNYPPQNQNNYNQQMNIGLNQNMPYGYNGSMNQMNGMGMGNYGMGFNYGQQPQDYQQTQANLSDGNIANNIGQPNNNRLENSGQSYEDAYKNMYGNYPEEEQMGGYKFNSGRNNYNTKSSSDNVEYNNMIITRNAVKVNKPLLIGITLLLLYIGFLVIGALGTTYKEENGQKIAVVSTLENREAREDYDTLKVYYLDMLQMMETANDYEYQMEKNLTPYFTLATNYEDILTVIDSRITKVKSLSINERYNALKMQESEAYNYIALYCQKMQIALVNDDYNSYAEALTWKETATITIDNVRKNLISMGEMDAKVFNDSDLENDASLDINTNPKIENPNSNENINTGIYGQDKNNGDTSSSTPQNGNQCGLGQGRNKDSNKNNDENGGNDTQKDNIIDNNENIDNQNGSNNQNIDDGNISIENPYK